MPVPPSPIVCSVCGTAPPAPGSDHTHPPAGWMSEAGPDRGTRWVCAACVRENLRAVEARLDQHWW